MKKQIAVIGLGLIGGDLISWQGKLNLPCRRAQARSASGVHLLRFEVLS